MNERERMKQRKHRIVDMMCSTAKSNGKPDNWYDMLGFANRLHRLESTLSRLAEDACCSQYFNKADEAKQERIEKLAEKLITETLGCKCYTQRDPRGFAIRMYLVDEDGRKWFNVWDGETTGLNW